jgi:hypothetical protein
MATNRNRKRIENIEKTLTPREQLAYYIEERAKFASREEYANWLAEDPDRRPLTKILQTIASASADGSPGASKNSLAQLYSSRQLKLYRSKQVKELMFLVHLLRMLDCQIPDLLAREASRLAVIALSLVTAKESLTSGMAMLHLNELLARGAHPGDANLTAALRFTTEAGDEFCRHGSPFGIVATGDLMKLNRAELYRSINSRALIAAIERLSARYFRGLKIVFKSDADALDNLAQQAKSLVRDYNKLTELLHAIPFHQGVLDGADKIDEAGIEQEVEKETTDLARRLVDLAQAETLFFFEERESDGEKALELGKKGLDLLRPMLKAEAKASA